MNAAPAALHVVVLQRRSPSQSQSQPQPLETSAAPPGQYRELARLPTVSRVHSLRLTRSTARSDLHLLAGAFHNGAGRILLADDRAESLLDSARLLAAYPHTAVLVRRDAPAGQDVVRARLRATQKNGYQLTSLDQDLLSEYVFGGMALLAADDAAAFASRLSAMEADSLAATADLHSSPTAAILNATNSIRALRPRALRLVPSADDGRPAGLDVAPMGGGSHATTYKLLPAGGGAPRLRKQAGGAGRAKLADEVAWLRSLDPAARRLFPQILSEDEGSVDLSYHDLPTLRTLLLDGRITPEAAVSVLVEVVRTLDDRVYRRVPGPREDYARRIHLDRVTGRVAETARRLPQYQRLWRSPTVVVNNRERENLWPLANRLAHHPKLAVLEPPRLLRIHGDLHFDNILVRPARPGFLLVDPRGAENYDIAYDVGKLFHSCHSLYDLLHAGHYRLRHEDTRLALTFTAPRLAVAYQRVHQELLAALDAWEPLRQEPHWQLRALFAEACHMASVMPFHLRQDGTESLALALYARGVELLNDVADRLDAL
ncbi:MULTISPECIES: phosphotransferase [unclassified Streptomyces]|uniref:phosphotransferase n=1 Tax=unclassified Streptomyces TaxID=2593676 RepID=UPI00278BC612|nr:MULTISPECIES: phosphotransferase [unclassified Streptomyces]